MKKNVVLLWGIAVALLAVICGSCTDRPAPPVPQRSFEAAVVFGVVARTGDGFTYSEIWAGEEDGRFSKLSLDPVCYNRSPAPSPDGRKIVFVACSDPYVVDLFIVNADGSSLHNLTRATDREETPVWSPDGIHIAYQAMGGSAKDIMIIDSSGAGFTKAAQVAFGDCILGGWSPDGKYVVYYETSHDFTNTATQIAISAVFGADRRTLTDGPGRKIAPAWSPRGDQIAYAKDGRLHTMLITGERDVELTGSPDSVEGPIRWTSDGRYLVFSAHPGGESDIYRIRSTGEDLQNLTTNYHRGFDPAVSPDDKQIAYVADLSYRRKIYLMNIDGTAKRPLSYFNADEFQPVWRASR
jgi:Tol biopolymer transport system component